MWFDFCDKERDSLLDKLSYILKCWCKDTAVLQFCVYSVQGIV